MCPDLGGGRAVFCLLWAKLSNKYSNKSRFIFKFQPHFFIIINLGRTGGCVFMTSRLQQQPSGWRGIHQHVIMNTYTQLCSAVAALDTMLYIVAMRELLAMQSWMLLVNTVVGWVQSCGCLVSVPFREQTVHTSRLRAGGACITWPFVRACVVPYVSNGQHHVLTLNMDRWRDERLEDRWLLQDYLLINVSIGKYDYSNF